MQGTQNVTQVLHRRYEVANRYLHGEQQYSIAKALQVSQSQVSLDLKVIRGEWLESMLRDFEAAKAQELAKIDQVEIEYWSAWQRSQKPKESNTTEVVFVGAGGQNRRAAQRKEDQLGDPRFLDGILKCVERRCLLLGLEAPKRFKFEWDKMSDAQLERLAAGEAPHRVLAEA